MVAQRDDELTVLGRRIEVARNHRGLTQEQLAEKAGCSPKVIRKVIRGERVRGHILSELCEVLDITVTSASHAVEISDEDHGSYSLNNFSQYVGRYFSYRRSLLYPRNILRSAFSIHWDKSGRVLRFNEYQQYVSLENGETVDRSQAGDVFFGNRSGLLHLLTKDRGALRLITLSQFRLLNPSDLTMHGIVLTQTPRQFQYQPSAAAIVFEKTKLSDSDFKKFVGEVRPNSHDYAKLHKALVESERHIVNFALSPPPQDPLKPDL